MTRFSGLCAFRCLGACAASTPHGALRPVQTLWLGPGRHFVHYPICGGRLVNIVAIVPAGCWRTESWTAQGETADLLNQFVGWDQRLHDLIDAATDAPSDGRCTTDHRSQRGPSAESRCSATRHARCCRSSRRVPRKRQKTPRCSPVA